MKKYNAKRNTKIEVVLNEEERKENSKERKPIVKS